ncbi:unnamed protein product [Brassica rapa subsp. narinosa]
MRPNRSLRCTFWVSSSHCFLTLFVKYRVNIPQQTAPSCGLQHPLRFPGLLSILLSLLRASCSCIVLVTVAFPVMFFAISNGLIGEGLVAWV